MEVLDVFIVGIGILTFFEAAKRLNIAGKAEAFKGSFEDVPPEGILEESTSFRLREEPLFLTPWKSGFGSFLNDRPILLVLAIVLMLGVFLTLVVLAMTNMKFAAVLIFSIIGWAFHNCPDHLNIDEFYLQKITMKDSTTLNGHDVLFIEKASSDFKG